jgi:hypothetical protein
MKYMATMLIVALLCGGCGKPEPPAKSPVETAAKPPVETAAKPSFHKLVGKWLRADGDYMIEVTGVTADGQMTAGYFNPNPIHVEKAVAGRTNSVVTVFIVLRDANYPGCTYTLTHDAATDQLRGEYYQAAQQQTYPVEFARGQ